MADSKGQFTEQELMERLSSPDEATRLDAVGALGVADALASARALVGALGDTSWRVRREAVDALARHSPPDIVEALVDVMRTDHRDLGFINGALSVLRTLDVDTVPHLAELLDGEDADLRVQAALALGEHRDARAVAPLVRALEDADANVRYQAIESLGRLGATEATAPLTAVALSGDFFLAFAAVDALGAIGDASVAPALVPLLDDELLGGPAAEALGRLGDMRVVDVLVEALNAGKAPAPVVSRALAEIERRIDAPLEPGGGIAGAVSRGVDDEGLQRLLAVAGAPDGDLRPIARVLGWLEGDAVEGVLAGLLGRPDASDEAVEALARRGRRVTGLLVERLGADDLEVRRAAATALGLVGDASAASALASALLEDPELATAACGALALIGGDRALDSLVGLLGHADAAVRQASERSVSSLGHPETAARVRQLVTDADPHVRESAVRLAGALGPECVDAVFERCRDDDERVRCAAIEAVSHLDDARVATEVAAASESDSPRVRAAASRALGRARDEASAGLLLSAIRDSDSWVRYFAVQAAGARGLTAAAGALVDLAETDGSIPVRIAAMEALGEVGGADAVAVLHSSASDDDPDVASAARRALESIARRVEGDRPDWSRGGPA